MTTTDWTDGLSAQLGTTIIGRELRFLPSVGSTNDLLKDAARAGAAEGLVLVTDEQTTGRGRRGRSWTAPAGSSLLLSILLRPGWLPASDAFLLTMLAAVAAAEALEHCGATVGLKWPNDLQIAGRKLGGILVETELRDDRIDWTVLGCGINVNWDPRDDPALATTATSLRLALGRPVERRALLTALLQRLDQHYLALRRGARTALSAAWRARLTMLGQPVRVETPGGVLEGVAEDVTHAGVLLVRTADGVCHPITAGDVTLRVQAPGDQAIG